MKSTLVILLLIASLVTAEDSRKTNLLRTCKGYTLRTLIVNLANYSLNNRESSKIKQIIINRIETYEYQQLFLKYLNYVLHANQIYIIKNKKNTIDISNIVSFIKHLQALRHYISQLNLLNHPD